MDVLSSFNHDRGLGMGFVHDIHSPGNNDKILIMDIIGFAFAFGVFQSYYRDNELFEDSNMVAAIGTCATVGLSHLT